MEENRWLAEQFEAHREHLRAVAYRMLGSLSEAEDAVQESWLRLARKGPGEVENPGGWLTTVVARVCLDMLRSRKSRREEPLPERSAEASATDPEREALLADTVGLALLVVLERLDPAERLAFVLHDMFAVPFEEIASIVGRSTAAARQLASRARRRVQGASAEPDADLAAQREVVAAFLAALRAGDIQGLLAVLDPDVVVRADAASARGGTPAEVRGARAWAKEAVGYSRGARFVRPAMVDGKVGAVLAPHGHLLRVLRFTIANGKIVEIEVVGDSARLAGLDLAVLER